MTVEEYINNRLNEAEAEFITQLAPCPFCGLPVVMVLMGRHYRVDCPPPRKELTGLAFLLEENYD